jgi:multicomponent Na+:H+ antiporter subunit B
MSERFRIVLYLFSALAFAAALGAAFAGLPDFGAYSGAYGPLVLESMQGMRHTQQGVAAVTFDYRGFDTLGEEFMLFAAVAGALLLLRRQESERFREPKDQASDRVGIEPAPAVLGLGLLMFPFTLLLGIYVVLHGHLTPGGGFQGGVLLATAFFYVYLSGEYGDLLEVAAGDTVARFEVAGAAGFLLLGTVPLFAARPYLQNVLPLGKLGELFSAGTLPLLNCAVGIEVTAAFLLVISAFLRQVLLIRKGKHS